MDLSVLSAAIVDGSPQVAVEAVQKALADGALPEDILNHGMMPAMEVVGHRFEENEYFLPELLASATAMKAGLAPLKPLLSERSVEPIGRVALGTVQGDMHDIGKNLVGMVLEGAGFEVVDLGTDVRPEQFVKAAQEVEIVGLSALLTTTLPQMARVVQALEEAGIRDRVKVLVGGAPVSEAYAKEIGADAYSPDAGSAARTARSLLGLTSAA